VLDVDTLMAAIMDAEGQRSRDIGRDLPLKTAVLHKRRCSTSWLFRVSPPFFSDPEYGSRARVFAPVGRHQPAMNRAFTITQKPQDF